MKRRLEAYRASTAAWPSASATRLGKLKCEVTVSDVAKDIVVAGRTAKTRRVLVIRKNGVLYMPRSVARTWVRLARIRLIHFGNFSTQEWKRTEAGRLPAVISLNRVFESYEERHRQHQHPGTCGNNEALRCAMVSRRWSNQTRLVCR